MNSVYFLNFHSVYYINHSYVSIYIYMAFIQFIYNEDWILLLQCFTLNRIGILHGYAIQSGRRPEGSLRSAPAADFPRDVCLTVSRNHAVFLLSSTNVYLTQQIWSFEIINPMIYQRMAYPRAREVASQATNSIRCPRADGASIYWITQDCT